MSLSNQSINLIGKLTSLLALVFLAVICFGPRSAAAKTIEFGKQIWIIDPIVSETVETVLVRNNVSFTALAQDAILGLPAGMPGQLLIEPNLAEIKKISSQINQASKSAKLIIENDRATEFDPGQNGQALDVHKLYDLLLDDLTIKLALPVIISKPAVQLAETNNLGITELVASGESDFTGSPANRLLNIRVGAEKFNGLIFPPGAEFSFNKFLGDVDAANGFLPELVIKKDSLVPEFGGGLCQVSSTTFRAAMNAGLPIVERRNHSFPVRYYAPQGTDATIYPGYTDFRFTNDLPSHLLIRTRVEKTKLFFDFYGTKDDRAVAFEGPVQYDKKTDGSMKATWTRTVVLNGEASTQTFKSSYLSPSLFTKTATVESNIPNPTANPPATN